MSDALKDLDALMVKAKDMVRLAADLNERLTASSTTITTNLATPIASSQSLASAPASLSPSPTPTLVPSTEPEEATFIRSSLSQLGLQMSNAPVTLDMIRDERKWIEELGRELAGVLQGRREDTQAGLRNDRMGIMRERGIIALDEVWGGWNRARGVGK
jgi:ESCRT-II complex subunit VPS36